jgi:glyoxylase-like metal-dependent hydrolase (beta-lactamase superfamily II)
LVAFLQELAPDYGVAEDVAPGVRRVVARNPGPMTYHGTNSWLVQSDDGLTLIDPGPDDSAHVAALVAAADGRLKRILLTHTHPDHVGAAAAVKVATGAPVMGWGRPWLAGFAPDVAVADGDSVGGLVAVYTPGHASDHLCFAWRDGALFSGDHVMSWNTSIVSPPDGDMAAYMEGLRLMLARDDRVFYCGHGPVLREPAALVRAMLVHRVGREQAVQAALSDEPRAPMAIVDALYADLDARLKRAAERTVLAHLMKLEAEKRAVEVNGAWRAAD